MWTVCKRFQFHGRCTIPVEMQLSFTSMCGWHGTEESLKDIVWGICAELSEMAAKEKVETSEKAKKVEDATK